MSINRLDNEISAFLRAQEVWKRTPEATGRLEVKSPIPFKGKVVPAKLQGRLDRHAEKKFEEGHLDFLRTLKGIDDKFVDYLKVQEVPHPVVRARGDDVMVRVDGKMCDLPLWEVPISNQVHDLYFNSIIADNGLDTNALGMEGIRRLQHKADLLRGSTFTFVEAGTRWRYAWDWYDLIMTLVMGDIPQIIEGTTNPLNALAHGIEVVAWEGSDFYRVSNPSVTDLAFLVDSEPRPIVVERTNAYEMAHLNSHFGRLLNFEWGADLTADMGPGGYALPLSFEMR